MMAEIGSRNV